ncbi:MAG: serpin family protein [Silvibacterium sp.]|nr:serpin family protein [Silvibacterium sp.]
MRRLLALAVLLMSGTTALPDQNTTDAARALAQPYAQFGFDVVRDLTTKSPHANAFISPTSIAVALAMTANGAEGSTRDAILAALHSQGQPTSTFNAANRALAGEIAKTTAVQLSIANAIWIQQGIAIEAAFRQTLQSEYSAEAANVDFRTPAAEHTINAWVAKHTNDRIRKLVENLDPSTITMLTNAIAFKGKWSAQFNAKETQPHDFTTAAGNTKKVPMMKHYGDYRYANANGIETIRLPYADETFAMYVVLPQDGAGMRSFIEQLSWDSFTGLISTLRSGKGTIELPRFTLEYSATLNSVLTKLGLEPAFGNAANFQNISKTQRLQISEVRHASFLKVDEEGTEAAAATSVGIRAAAVMVQPPPFHMVVDRPFFIAIRDERNGQVFFTGMIAKPED